MALDEFQSEVAERGIDAVIFDMIKNLLHKIPTTEEVNQGVEQYNSGKGPEYVISLMNDPTVIERFKQDKNLQLLNIYIALWFIGLRELSVTVPFLLSCH